MTRETKWATDILRLKESKAPARQVMGSPTHAVERSGVNGIPR